MQTLVDKDGTEFVLESETWEHICEFHPEITDVNMLQEVIAQPEAIIRSSWDTQTFLYYRRLRKNRYRVVVVDMRHRRIKTSLSADRIKEGEVIWPRKQFML